MNKYHKAARILLWVTVLLLFIGLMGSDFMVLMATLSCIGMLFMFVLAILAQAEENIVIRQNKKPKRNYY